MAPNHEDSTMNIVLVIIIIIIINIFKAGGKRTRLDIIVLLLLFCDPGTQFPGNEKNYAMQYKKAQKSSWSESYSSSFTKQSCIVSLNQNGESLK